MQEWNWTGKMGSHKPFTRKVQNFIQSKMVINSWHVLLRVALEENQMNQIFI